MSRTEATSFTKYYQDIVTHYMAAGMAALLIYDHVLILGREVNVTGRGSNARSVLFFANRCVMLAMVISLLCQLGSYQAKTVRKFEALAIFYSCVNIAPGLIWTVFSTLRLYAVCRGKLLLPTMTLLLGVASASTNLAFHSTTRLVANMGHSLAQISSLSDSVQLGFQYFAIVSPMLSEIIAIITIWREIEFREEHCTSRVSFASVLVRDGTASFILLLTVSIINLALLGLKTNIQFAVVYNALLPVLMSRTMLNLRECCFNPGDLSGVEVQDRTTTEDSLRFRSQPSFPANEVTELADDAQTSHPRLASASIISEHNINDIEIQARDAVDDICQEQRSWWDDES